MAMGKKEILPVAMAYILLVVSASGATHNNKQVGKETKEAEADRISELPGQPKVSFQQYSGYVTSNKVAGRALFYWFNEAVNHPQNQPLVIWLNGGPGCSSVGFGAMDEIGPFRVNTKGSGLYRNKFAWNTVANLLFIESPTGVGFSYSNTSSDIGTHDDHRIATDNLEFIIQWLDRFPRYKKRKLYLTGESYAGYYVPTLAKEIMLYNSRSKDPLNFIGIMVGNPVIDDYHDNLGQTHYLRNHAMISEETYSLLLKCYQNPRSVTDGCTDEDTAGEMDFGNIDRYNIYGPTCHLSDGNGTQLRPHSVSGYDPCTQQYTGIYLNRPDVQKALHANTTNIPYKWSNCSDTILMNFTKVNTVLPIYKDMVAAGLRVWVFSGDADLGVTVTGTMMCLDQLKLKIKIPWYPWYVNNEVAGRTVIYEGLTFATVRGSGHQVPHFKPKEALQLFKSFLRGEPLPNEGAPH